MPERIEVRAVISKAQLVECDKHYTDRRVEFDPTIGRDKLFVREKVSVNSKPYRIGDREFPPRMLRYVTFAGAIDMSDRLYKGVQRFEALDSPDATSEAFDFAEIPFEAPPGAVFVPKSAAQKLSDDELLAELRRRGLQKQPRQEQVHQKPANLPKED